MKKQRIVIKIGTNAMTKANQTLDEKLLEDLVNQVAKIHKDNEVLLVTSGAMGAGRTLINAERHDDVTSRQIYAVVGQVKLMGLYAKFFAKKKITVAQMLATKEDFTIRAHYLNTKNCLESLFQEKVVPIMNENDFVAVEELMFTDNDELAGMISKMLCADKLIVLTNVDGVYDRKGKVIAEFNYLDEMPPHIANTKDTSSFGKGGMQTKFAMAKAAATNGTEVVVANSKKKDVLIKIVSGEKIGTRFAPKKFEEYV